MSRKDKQFYIDQIDSYLEGRLESIDSIKFESEIENDPMLKEQVELHLLSRSIIRKAAEQELKNKFLNSLQVSNKPIDKAKSFPSVKLILTALFVLLTMIGLSIFCLPKIDRLDNSETVVALAEIEDPSYTLVRNHSNLPYNSTWKNATMEFASKNYESTLVILDTLLNDSNFLVDHKGKYALMRGVSYLKTENFASAEESLLEVVQGNPYYDQAEWYLGLTAFYAKDFDTARIRFQGIVNNSDHYKASAAKSYLKSLE